MTSATLRSLALAALAVLAPPSSGAGNALPAPPAAPRAPADPGAFAVPVVPEISVAIEPTDPEVGLVMTITVTVTGAEGADCQLIEVPDVDGGRLTHTGGPSTQNMSLSVNGRRRSSITTSWRFELVPERAGELLLPGFRFHCRGSEVASEPQVLVVGEGRLIDDIVRLSVVPSTTDVWVGQVLEVVVTASVLEEAWDAIPQRNGFELELPWLEGLPGLHVKEAPTPQCNAALMAVNRGSRQIPVCRERSFESGVPRQVFTGTIPLLATAPGTLILPASRFGVRLVVEGQERNGQLDLLSMLGRRTFVPTRIQVTEVVAEGVGIVVRPTPTEGRPAGFTNAVGRFRFEGQAHPTTLEVGESCKLSLALSVDGRSGSANLEQVEWPAYDELAADFRIFGKDERRTADGRVLEFEISPKTSDVDAIPALSFAYFDPEAERYETITVGPFPLEVTAGGEEGLAYLTTPEEILNDLETIREELPPPAEPGLPPWVPPVGALLVLVLAEVSVRGRRWRAAHPALVARRGARRQLERDLDRVAAAKDVAAAFARYLAARLGGPPAGLTAEEASERIPDRALADELRRTVSAWEAAYLGGARLEPVAAATQARALADRLEASP